MKKILFSLLFCGSLCFAVDTNWVSNFVSNNVNSKINYKPTLWRSYALRDNTNLLAISELRYGDRILVMLSGTNPPVNELGQKLSYNWIGYITLDIPSNAPPFPPLISVEKR